MAWVDSRVFREWVAGPMLRAGAGYTGLVSDTVKVALFNNTVTPDRDAAAAATRYGTGTWATAGEVTSGADWPAGGKPLPSKTVTTPDPGTVVFNSPTLASGSAANLTNAYGCLIYDDSITGSFADQGVCFNFFGGAQSVTTGTFTLVWNAGGILRLTV